MFHRERDASKVALVALVEGLRASDPAERLLDVQWATPHLESLGVVEIEPGGVPAPSRARSARPGAGPLQAWADPAQTTRGGWPVSLTIGRPAAAQSSIPPSRLTTS